MLNLSVSARRAGRERGRDGQVREACCCCWHSLQSGGMRADASLTSAGEPWTRVRPVWCARCKGTWGLGTHACMASAISGGPVPPSPGCRRLQRFADLSPPLSCPRPPPPPLPGADQPERPAAAHRHQRHRGRQQPAAGAAGVRHRACGWVVAVPVHVMCFGCRRGRGVEGRRAGGGHTYGRVINHVTPSTTARIACRLPSKMTMTQMQHACSPALLPWRKNNQRSLQNCIVHHNW